MRQQSRVQGTSGTTMSSETSNLLISFIHIFKKSSLYTRCSPISWFLRWDAAIKDFCLLTKMTKVLFILVSRITF